MKIRYMIDNVARGLEGDNPEYVPVGVWAHAPGTNRMDFAYIKSSASDVEYQRTHAHEVLNRIVKHYEGVIPEDFLEYHRMTRSMYDGVFSEIKETDEFDRPTALTASILRKISKAGK